MDDLPDRALRFARRHGLLNPGERAVIAFSGGADSVALALALEALRDDGRLPLALSLAHLNHMLRGAEADRDEAFCRDFADAHSLPIAIERADVRAHVRTHGGSLEAAARRLRYEFLARAADRAGAGAVLTAHHADDVAETVLLRLVRGAGLHGLGAMAPTRPLDDAGRPHLRLVRLLLEVPRADLLAYVQRRGQAFCTDSTNRDTRHARNRVRHLLMPLLAREFPTFSTAALAGLNASALESAALLDSLLDDLWPRLCLRAGPREVVLAAAPLADAAAPLRKAAGRRAFGRLCTPPAPALRFGHMEELARLPGRPVGTCLALPRGVRARREHGVVRFLVGPAEGWPPRTLPVPGAVELPEAGLRLEATVLPAGSLAASEAAARATEGRVFLDVRTTGRRLVVRTRTPGDRFHPLGAPGEGRLKGFFINARVPRGDRDRIPLVATDDGAVVWVVGHRIGEPFRLRGDDAPVLCLQAERTDRPPV